LAKGRKIARTCALNKAYSGEPEWKAIGDRLQRPYYLSRVDDDWKIRNRRQSTHIGKYTFVNRTIQLWNKLLINVLWTLPSKPRTFRNRARKVISELKGSDVKGIRSEEEIEYFQEQGLKCDK
jgi:hypothetical protein